MQRRSSKKTRAENADEKRFKIWVAEQPCIECGDYPVIVDHMYGSCFKHNKVLIGMWALLPLCEQCDRVKTFGSANEYLKVFGRTQAQAWYELVSGSNNKAIQFSMPPEVYAAIRDWDK